MIPLTTQVWGLGTVAKRPSGAIRALISSVQIPYHDIQEEIAHYISSAWTLDPSFDRHKLVPYDCGRQLRHKIANRFRQSFQESVLDVFPTTVSTSTRELTWLESLRCSENFNVHPPWSAFRSGNQPSSFHLAKTKDSPGNPMLLFDDGYCQRLYFSKDFGCRESLLTITSETVLPWCSIMPIVHKV